jgi:hypothetical protein
MSEPQEKQEMPSDVAGDNPPAVETTAGDDAKDNDGGRDLSKANPLNQAAKGAAPGVPRTIRSRTGQTEDPVPEGKHVAEHKVRLPVVAQEDKEADAPQIAAAIAAGAHPQSAKEDKKAHKEELERLHGAALKHQNADMKRPGDFQHSNKMNMDSRRSHFGQKQHTSTQS